MKDYASLTDAEMIDVVFDALWVWPVLAPDVAEAAVARNIVYIDNDRAYYTSYARRLMRANGRNIAAS